MEWTIFIILVIILISVYVIHKYEEYVANTTLRLYNKIDMSNNPKQATEFINYAGSKPKQSLLENYRIGNIYDHILKNDIKAHEYYTRAINQAMAAKNEDAFFVWTRLRDRIDINHMFETDDVKYDLFNLNELDVELKELETALLTIYSEDTRPKYKKSLEDHVHWVTDNQNVHDKNINDHLRKGYDQIRYENEYNFLWDIPNIIGYLCGIYAAEADKAELKNIDPAIKMLEYIDEKGSNNIMKLNDTERNFISNVFTKIYNEENHHKRKTMLENFVLNLKDSYSDGSPVCITGRTARIMSSFTNMDDTNQDLGILKDKPMIRNEILLKAANVRNKLYEAAPKDVQNKYDKSVEDESVKELETVIMRSIMDMIDTDYKEIKRTDSDFILGIIKEIETSI